MRSFQSIWTKFTERTFSRINSVEFKRAVFFVYFFSGCGIILGGLAMLIEWYGFQGMIGGVFAVYMLYLWSLRWVPVGGGADPEMREWMGVPPPRKPQLPPSGTAQIGRASTAITPSRPGPVARDGSRKAKYVGWPRYDPRRAVCRPAAGRRR
jgi:hypothetical protein